MDWRGMTRRAFVVGVLIAAAGLALASVSGAPSGSSTERMLSLATLTSSSAYGPTGFGWVAGSGSTIAAIPFWLGVQPGATSVSIFTKPAGAWAVEPAVAQLSPDSGDSGGPLAISGDDIFEGLPGAVGGGSSDPRISYVFAKPAGGWSGIVHQSADLVPSARMTASAAQSQPPGTQSSRLVVARALCSSSRLEARRGWFIKPRPY